MGRMVGMRLRSLIRPDISLLVAVYDQLGACINFPGCRWIVMEARRNNFHGGNDVYG